MVLFNFNQSCLLLNKISLKTKTLGSFKTLKIFPLLLNENLRLKFTPFSLFKAQRLIRSSLLPLFTFFFKPPIL